DPVLRTVIQVVDETLSPEQSAALLKEVARRMLAAAFGDVPQGEPRQRLETLLERLRSATTAVQVEEDAGAVSVRACGCPLASVTADQPRVCEALAEALTDLVGAPV